VIVFAARAGLAANKEVIEVLHLVGATNDFIAGQVQRRYFSLGLKGGIAGALLAGAVLLLLPLTAGEQASDFMPDIEAGALMAAWLAVVPLILCATAAVSARFAVLRTLKARF
jgi:cell division transport system permease protein